MSEEYFKRILDSLEEGVSIIDRDFRIEWVNKALKNKGFDIEAIRGHKCHLVYKQHHEICKGCPSLRVFRSGKIVTMTEKGADGKEYEVTAVPIKEEGRVVKVVEIVKEAEDRKAEKELKQFKFMVESAHDAIFFKDLKSRYIIVNNKTLEAFGLPRRKVIGKNDYEIMPDKKEAEKNIKDDQQVFKTGKPTEIIKHMTGAHGKEHWFHAIKVPQFDDEGNIMGLVGIARDITELKKAEKEIKKAYEDLKKRTEELEKFQKISIGRELKMVELKKELERLKRGG